MRKSFSEQLKARMKANRNIYLLLGGVGYGYFESRGGNTISCEASEQAMVDMAVGMATEGKIPFVYFITPHIYRAFESIRIYLNRYKIPVKLVGSGRGRGYGNLGFTHWAEDAEDVFGIFPNICRHLDGDTFDLDHIIISGKPEVLTLDR